MSAVETKVETVIRKGEVRVTRELQSFEEIELPGNASDIRLIQEAGVWTLSYVQVAQADERSQKQVSIRGAASSEPLATHPKFADITDDEWEKYRRWEDDPEDPELNGWKPLQHGSAGLIAYHQKRLRGVTDYFRPTVTLRVTEQNQGRVDLQGLCKIGSPGVNVDVPGSGNWLLVNIEGDDPGDGTDFAVTKEYMASGPGGWDPDLYK